METYTIVFKALYRHPLACIKINGHISERFDISSGVQLGDSLSPTLFGLYINDLIKEVKKLNLGVKVEEELVSKELQQILKCMET